MISYLLSLWLTPSCCSLTMTQQTPDPGYKWVDDKDWCIKCVQQDWWCAVNPGHACWQCCCSKIACSMMTAVRARSRSCSQAPRKPAPCQCSPSAPLTLNCGKSQCSKANVRPQHQPIHPGNKVSHSLFKQFNIISIDIPSSFWWGIDQYSSMATREDIEDGKSIINGRWKWHEPSHNTRRQYKYIQCTRSWGGGCPFEGKAGQNGMKGGQSEWQVGHCAQRSSQLTAGGWSNAGTDVPNTIPPSMSGIMAGICTNTAGIWLNLCQGHAVLSPQSTKPVGTSTYHNAGRNGIVWQSILAWLKRADWHPWYAGCTPQQYLKSWGDNSRLGQWKGCQQANQW